MSGSPYFVIFGAMRTGSNLLERTLAELGDTMCFGEAFNPSFVGGPNRAELLGWDVAARDADPAGFLAAMREEGGARLPGFRIFEGHAPELTRTLLADPDCRRIILRRDPLQSYLSLKAAQETGQWMLRNPARRIVQRVPFVGVEFDTYRDRLLAHYRWLEAEMRRAGTDALLLDYAELQDRDVLERVARHIGSMGQIPEVQPILRQNPEHLADRVTNYDEMCDWLGLNPEPRRTVALPDSIAILLCRQAPLALAPLAGPGEEAGLSLLYRLARRSFGAPSLSYAQLLDPVARGTVFHAGLSTGNLKPELTGRTLITVICHPLVRLHGLFQGELFGKDWFTSVIRRRLVGMHGGIPSPREMAEGTKTLETPRHAAAFASFLDLVDAARGGQGDVPDRAAWHPQATLLDTYRKHAQIGAVVPLETLGTFAGRLAADLGVPALPQKHLDVFIARAMGEHLGISDVMTPEILARVEQIHAADFERFGYALRPGGKGITPPS